VWIGDLARVEPREAGLSGVKLVCGERTCVTWMLIKGTTLCLGALVHWE
jgi:hypothetical protein